MGEKEEEEGEEGEGEGEEEEETNCKVGTRWVRQLFRYGWWER